MKELSSRVTGMLYTIYVESAEADCEGAAGSALVLRHELAFSRVGDTVFAQIHDVAAHRRIVDPENMRRARAGRAVRLDADCPPLMRDLLGGFRHFPSGR